MTNCAQQPNWTYCWLVAREVGLEPTMVCRRWLWRPMQSPLCDSLINCFTFLPLVCLTAFGLLRSKARYVHLSTWLPMEQHIGGNGSSRNFIPRLTVLCPTVERHSHMAASIGTAPISTDSKSVVLLLHQPAIFLIVGSQSAIRTYTIFHLCFS